jgi:biopolymer transport protein ExbB
MRKISCKYLLCIIALTSASFSISVSANEKLERELIERIAKSKSELSALEKKTSQERIQYADNLDRKQQQIKKLREQAAGLQRMADEQLLGLDQLQARVDQWSSQSNYQKHVLGSYIESTNLTSAKLLTADGTAAIGENTLVLIFDDVAKRLAPTWEEKEIISANGSIVKASTLTTGPIEVALLQPGTGGLVSREIVGEPRILEIFDSSALKELESLKNNSVGQLSFDPTLGNALQLRQSQDTLLVHLQKGGVWAIPIVFFGLLSFVIALLKSWQLLKLPKVDSTLSERLNAFVNERRHKPEPISAAEFREKVKSFAANAGAPQQKLIQIAASSPVSQQRDDLLVAYLMEYKHQLERYMGIVATSASVAPLLGLLGTVSGMISTFQMMTIFGSGDAATVSGGISEALITTELGLIVAIPSLLMSALLSRKAKSYAHELENFAIKLSKIQFIAS